MVKLQNKQENLKTVTVIDPIYITMRDGVKLAARVWLPDDTMELCPGGTETYPMLLEALPYRRRDSTPDNDEPNHRRFAEAGYICVRLDFRGMGDSHGFMEDELTAKEQSDVIETLEWFAGQKFCTGRTGMFGYSWGGINSLTAAANRPPSLAAIISIDSLVDRYFEDIHFKNGVPLKGSVYWAALMLAVGARPPDPDIVGSEWKTMWRTRLEKHFFQTPIWKSHPQPDYFWKMGSTAEKWRECQVPVLAIGGWEDCYRDAPAKIVKNWPTTAKAIVGPWGHYYPQWADPAPTYNLYPEAIAWWDHWLKGVKTVGYDLKKIPAYRAFLARAAKPEQKGQPFRFDGQWVGVDSLPSRKIIWENYYLHSQSMETVPALDGVRMVATPLNCGQALGSEFPMGRGEFPKDQQVDDDLASCFDTAPLAKDLSILGKPMVHLRVNIDEAYGQLVARLVDVHPDGTAYLVSIGALNLAYRQGFAEPLLTNGTASVEFDLFESGYVFAAGHRIRLAISTSYFPLMMPPPFAVTARLELPECYLELPVIDGQLPIVEMPEVKPGDIPKIIFEKTKGYGGDAFSQDQAEFDAAGIWHWKKETVWAATLHPEHHIQSQEQQIEHWQVDPTDPLSVVGETIMRRWTSRKAEDSTNGIGFVTMVEGRSRYSCDRDNIYLEGELTVTLEDQPFFHRKWNETLPRHFN
ncbi:MAG: CocE/NonD family hydrolase [Candidatus Pacebacteria bacterium]|nr:CocE/NonD family hydrolase [Candidatus Paceibacterota bacterium]